MYVLSEDGATLIPVASAVLELLTPEDAATVAAEVGPEMHTLAAGLAWDAAKARLADVVAWLDHPLVVKTEFVMDAFLRTGEKQYIKPTVYEFAREIGYWKGASA